VGGDLTGQVVSLVLIQEIMSGHEVQGTLLGVTPVEEVSEISFGSL
jgi:hypothetical protein